MRRPPIGPANDTRLKLGYLAAFEGKDTEVDAYPAAPKQLRTSHDFRLSARYLEMQEAASPIELEAFP